MCTLIWSRIDSVCVYTYAWLYVHMCVCVGVFTDIHIYICHGAALMVSVLLFFPARLLFVAVLVILVTLVNVCRGVVCPQPYSISLDRKRKGVEYVGQFVANKPHDYT